MFVLFIYPTQVTKFQFSKDVILNVDACYTQKHSSKAGRDPSRVHPDTFFIPEADVKAWKQYVDTVRPPKKSNKPPPKQRKTVDEPDDHFEKGLRVPKSVLDGCMSSFTAADKARIKGSPRFFDVTANMTLLCRHDRPLFSTNIDTAGEGQHFVLALLAKVFEHLPPEVHVYFLYDIGCQLHRSCQKWGFFKPYLTRLSFAVSIFHAFGHQWPCQLIYHPCKCIGYGLSDGEGAEQLWHALSHLIAYRRVAGVSSIILLNKADDVSLSSTMSVCTIQIASSTSTTKKESTSLDTGWPANCWPVMRS